MNGGAGHYGNGRSRDTGFAARAPQNLRPQTASALAFRAEAGKDRVLECQPANRVRSEPDFVGHKSLHRAGSKNDWASGVGTESEITLGRSAWQCIAHAASKCNSQLASQRADHTEIYLVYLPGSWWRLGHLCTCQQTRTAKSAFGVFGLFHSELCALCGSSKPALSGCPVFRLGYLHVPPGCAVGRVPR